ncbi:4'-phosphopantetheinyl transferase superfamily protein [Cnuella takakiae]|uniref:4'-phosphopantetheinyl transferase superfamily protein n=1 Tax=Cnuella takakiae TaxID=1302690 RepID=A0A1M5B789_9BACT|nr:4'-phosphopantetheinyl transferase superfamily protein [Cnuella takakiae]OLY94911.1 hypothetical protein BUE76_16835 [Cnuella takakiae]SHF38276.1 4'-phosphopantetheinyl transferase superfamily protein [Cnuella takakiae]
MPLFFQQDVNHDARLAVWLIGEEEAFFRKLAIPQREVVHPHKRLQHLSGRFLLRHLYPDFPSELIRIADTRKPYLEDDAYHFSISHCSDYAAAIVSPGQRVGIDIEVVTEKAARIRAKFAADEEWALAQQAVQSLEWTGSIDALAATLIWSCKEAGFKWYGTGEVDFKKHMPIQACTRKGDVFETKMLFQKETPQALHICSRLLGGIWLSYVVA